MTTGPDITATTRAPRRSSAPPSVRRATVAAVVVALLGALACVAGGDAERGGRGGSSGGALTVSTAQRATVVGFMHDTLSPAARISALYPGVGADSAVVAFVFADSARGVGAGLGVLDLRAPGGERMARLAWPDSVGAVWWSGPHVLAFVTQRGVTAKVDVNADTLAVALDSGRAAHAAPATPPAAPPVPAAAGPRATAFVDSAHQQPAGRAAPRSALRYAVESMVAAPGGRLVALYVAATDAASGRRVNPAWYALALPSGAVASIDSIVGPIDELPATAAAWGGPDSATFYYARGKQVYGARVR